MDHKQIQNPFLTAQSTQIKSVISVPIKDFIHHYPRALFNDIPRVGAHFYDIPGSGRNFTTYPGRDALLRHTRVGPHFYDIPGWGRSLTTYPGQGPQAGRSYSPPLSRVMGVGRQQ